MLLVRRVSGSSMQPLLPPGRIVVAWRHPHRLKVGDVVILRHDGLEKIKRIQKLRASEVFVVGDEPNSSTDSRQFGWLEQSCIIGRVWWPKLVNTDTRSIRQV